MLRTDHPLTDGLEGFWLPVHGRQGGSRLYDLSQNGYTGSISGPTWTTNAAIPTPVLDWGNTSTNTNEVVFNTPIVEGGDFTIFSYLSVGAVSDGAEAVIVDEAVTNASPGDPSWRLYGSTDFGAANNQVRMWSSVAGELLVGPDIRGAGPTTVLVRRSGDEYTLYINGDLYDTTTDANSFPNVDETRFGNDEVDGSRGLVGEMFAMLIANTAVSNPSALDDQARRGFPDLLRRRDQSALYTTTTAGVSSTAIFKGEGTQQSSASKNTDSTTALTGEGTQGNTPEKALSLSTSLTGSGEILSSVDKDLAQTITLTGQGTQGTTADKDLDVAIVITGGGTIGNTYTTGTSVSSTATFTGVGEIQSAVSADRTSVALLTGAGDVVAVGAKEVQDALRLTGEPTAQNVYESLKEAATSFDGQGTQQATGTKATDATSVLTGQGRISIQGTTAELGSAVDVVELTAIWDKDVDLVAVFDLTKDLDAQI